jgi:hypothetical protein
MSTNNEVVETVASSEPTSFSSQAEYAKWKESGYQSTAAEESTEEAEESSADEVEETESETAEDEKDASEEKSQEKVEEAQKPKGGRANDRIRELVGERDSERQRVAALEARLRDLEARTSSTPKPEAKPNTTQQPTGSQLPAYPKLSDVDYDEDRYAESVQQWFDKRDAHVENQRQAKIAEAKQQEIAQAENKRALDRIAEGRSKFSDFDQVVLQRSDLTITPAMAHILVHEENGADLAYFLGKNPDEAKRIASLPDLSQAAALVRLGIEKLPKPTAETSKKIKPAFEPPTALKATGSQTTKSLGEARTQSEYVALKKRLFKR